MKKLSVKYFLKNYQKLPLICCFCFLGQLPIVQMLIDSGADMNAVTMHGATPIMRAIEASRAEVVEYLLEKGQSPSSPFKCARVAK